MRMLWAILFIVLAGGCDQAAPEKEKDDAPIIDNLPINDRDLLLEPLESAMDDLREVAEFDPGLFESSTPIDQDNYIGELRFKLDGKDTVLIDLQLHTEASMQERHQYFFDNKGQLFLTEHLIEDAYLGFDAGTNERRYKFYYEDGNLLSSYARISMDTSKVPEVWTPVCLTTSEERYYRTRWKSFSSPVRSN